MAYRTFKPHVSAHQRRLRAQARHGWTVVAACAFTFGAALYGAAELDARTAPAPQAAPAQSWQLVQFYRGNAYVLDHGLTHDDCDDAMPRNQAAKHIRFACELEG